MSKYIFNGVAVDPNQIIENFKSILGMLPNTTLKAVSKTSNRNLKGGGYKDLPDGIRKIFNKVGRPALDCINLLEEAARIKSNDTGNLTHWYKLSEKEISSIVSDFKESEGIKEIEPASEEEILAAIEAKKNKNKSSSSSDVKEETETKEEKDANKIKTKSKSATEKRNRLINYLRPFSIGIDDLPMGLYTDYMKTKIIGEEDFIASNATTLGVLKTVSETSKERSTAKKKLEDVELLDKLAKSENDKLKLKKSVVEEPLKVVAPKEVVKKFENNPKGSLKKGGGRPRKEKVAKIKKEKVPKSKKSDNIASIKIVV